MGRLDKSPGRTRFPSAHNNGNTTASSGISYTYDFQNRMLMAGAIINVYDGDGNRVSQTVGSTTTTYLVDTLNPTHYAQVMDELVSGAVTRTFTYGLRPISENQLVSSTWTPTFYGFDSHGNVRFLANTAGTLTDNYQFDAFGMPIYTSGTTSNPFRYSGERFDSNLNFYYLRARFYNMLTGRFMTMDPYLGTVFDPATLHKYVYAQVIRLTGSIPVDGDFLKKSSSISKPLLQRTAERYWGGRLRKSSAWKPPRFTPWRTRSLLRGKSNSWSGIVCPH